MEGRRVEGGKEKEEKLYYWRVKQNRSGKNTLRERRNETTRGVR